MSDYIPIDCELYSRYELAIIRRQPLRVAWRSPPRGMLHLETLLPLDLRTRDHAEYLVAGTARNTTLELRLDRIIRASPCSRSTQSESRKGESGRLF
jgi:Rho-binding antiterminator